MWKSELTLWDGGLESDRGRASLSCPALVVQAGDLPDHRQLRRSWGPHWAQATAELAGRAAVPAAAGTCPPVHR